MTGIYKYYDSIRLYMMVCACPLGSLWALFCRVQLGTWKLWKTALVPLHFLCISFAFEGQGIQRASSDSVDSHKVRSEILRIVRLRSLGAEICQIFASGSEPSPQEAKVIRFFFLSQRERPMVSNGIQWYQMVSNGIQCQWSIRIPIINGIVQYCSHQMFACSVCQFVFWLQKLCAWQVLHRDSILRRP